MASRDETARASVHMDAEQAKAELGKLSDRAKELRKEMLLLGQANDKAGFDRAEKQYKAVTNEMKQLNKQAFDVKNVLNNLNKTNFNDLQRAQKQISAELKKMERGTAEYVAKSKELRLVSAEVSKVRAEMNGFEKAGQSSNKVMGLFSKGTAIFGAVAYAVSRVTSSVVGFGKRSVEAFSEAAKTQAQVEAVIKSTAGVAGITSEHVDNLAVSLQNTTLFEDDLIKKSEALLLTFTNIRGVNFDKATTSILEVATAVAKANNEQIDLTKTTLQVGKALNNPIEGLKSLTRMGVSFTEQQKEQIKTLQQSGKLQEAQTIILNELGRQFGGVAANVAKADASFGQTKNKMNDLSEAIGERFFRAVNNSKGVINELVDTLTGWFKIPISDKLREEQAQVNGLTNTLIDNNAPQKVREQAYANLLTIAPQVVEGINKENIDIVKLTGNLEKYNKQLYLKIGLQSNAERIEKINKTISDAQDKAFFSTQRLNKETERLYGEIALAGGGKAAAAVKAQFLSQKISAEEYAVSIGKLASEYKVFTGAEGRTKEGIKIKGEGSKSAFEVYIEAAISSEAEFKRINQESTQALNDLLERNADLETQLNKIGGGKKLDTKTENDNSPKKSNKKTDSEADKKQKELEKEFNKLEKLSQEYNDFLYVSNQQSADKEIQAIYLKYKRQLEEVEINEQLKNDLINKVNTEGLENLSELEARQYDAIYKNQLAANKEVSDKILSQDKEFNDAKQALEENIRQMGMSEDEREIQAVSDKYEKLRLSNDKYYTDEKTRQENLKKLMQLEEAEKTAIVKKYQAEQVRATTEAAEKIRQEEIKKFQGFKDGMSAVSGLLGDIYNLISQRQGEATEEAKIFAYAQIAINTGVALANGIAAASKASTWYEVLIALVGVAGSIIGAMSAAYSYVDGASYAEGGETGPGINYSDESGQPVAGVVHANEYVIPAWERKIPQIAAMENVIEAVRKKGSFAAGGETTHPSGFRPGKKTGTGSDIAINVTSDEKLTNAINALVDSTKKPLNANITYTKIKNMADKVSDFENDYGL